MSLPWCLHFGCLYVLKNVSNTSSVLTPLLHVRVSFQLSPTNQISLTAFPSPHRIVGGDQTGPWLQRSPSPGQRVLSPPSPLSPPAQLLSPEPAAAPATAQPLQSRRSQRHLESLTSPPDSEAYYGETDSDADNVAQEKQRRARKKSPRSPPDSTSSKADGPQDEVSLSEQSGYESTPEAAAPGEPEAASSVGVARREIACPPDSRTDSPFSESEGQLRPPLTEGREPSPEAMLLPHATKAIRAERHLIPMVGPVEHPVDEDLTTTYAEKAKQASKSSAPCHSPMPSAYTASPSKSLVPANVKWVSSSSLGRSRVKVRPAGTGASYCSFGTGVYFTHDVPRNRGEKGSGIWESLVGAAATQPAVL